MPPPSKRPRTDSNVTSEPRPQELGIMRQEVGGHGSASFVGSASGIHFVQSVYQAVNQASPAAQSSHQEPHQELVPGEEDQLPGRSPGQDPVTLWRSDETTSRMLSVSFEDLVRWSRSYFDHWHPILPFLHGPEFLEWCEKISNRAPSDMHQHMSTFQLAVIRSVLSICLADRRQTKSDSATDPMPPSLVFESYEDAMASVQSVLVAPPSNESLQAAMSVQLFLISMLRHNAASRIGGVVVRLLYQMGLHRCPFRYSHFSHDECLLRKRLFWSIYCIERYLCQSLGTPLTLRDDDIDVCSLCEEEHRREELNHARKWTRGGVASCADH